MNKCCLCNKEREMESSFFSQPFKTIRGDYLNNFPCIFPFSVSGMPAMPGSLPGIGSQSPHLEGAHSLLNASATAMLLSLQMEESGPLKNVSIKVSQDEREATVLQTLKCICKIKIAFLKKTHESRNKCDQREKKRESKCIERQS